MITDVRAYIRARAKAIGLTEWTDAFNVANIPSTMIIIGTRKTPDARTVNQYINPPSSIFEMYWICAYTKPTVT